MRSNELLLYAYEQIQQTLRRAVQGLTPEELTRRVGPEVLNPVDEASWVDTNTTALYGLAAIQNLALIGDRLKS